MVVEWCGRNDALGLVPIHTHTADMDLVAAAEAAVGTELAAAETAGGTDSWAVAHKPVTAAGRRKPWVLFVEQAVGRLVLVGVEVGETVGTEVVPEVVGT